jgi:hypothetical protein
MVMMKGKGETKMNAITDANLEGLIFFACNTFNLAWRIQNYGS